MKTIIRGGTIISASDECEADILVENEKISMIGTDLPTEGIDQIVEAQGRFILPGGIDPHTHFDLPMFNTVSSDDHYSGHKAAAFGGTTTVLDFVPQTGYDLKKILVIGLLKQRQKQPLIMVFT